MHKLTPIIRICDSLVLNHPCNFIYFMENVLFMKKPTNLDFV